MTNNKPALKRIAASVGFALAAGVSSLGLAGTPYSGTPIALPGSFEAENFDLGGEGSGYHDLSAGNSGGLYRTSESVDIIASTDSAGGGYVVNNIQTGEWLSYTVKVAAAGRYDIALRVANNYSGTPSFHIEVDGTSVTGSVKVPSTGNWSSFQKLIIPGVSLPAGQHVLKIVADAQYFNLNSVSVTASPVSGGYAGKPYTGTAIALPGSFEAENFDLGGEGVGYHDLSKGNTGALYRLNEDVDIVTSTDGAGGGYVVNNFQTGEWLGYTVNVAAAGKYDISLRLANKYTTTPAFHIEVDGANLTGSLTVPSTGSWDSFQTLTVPGVSLPAGQHVLRIVSDAQYFNLNSVSVAAPASTAAYAGTPYTGTPVALPIAFAAVNFDKGGEGVAYHDLTTGNAGAQYRTSEDVDIAATTDTLGVSPYLVNSFQTGEWLNYTVNVSKDGNYDVSLRAANNYAATPPAAFHIEMDGKDVTGKQAVPITGGWDAYQWVSAPSVALKAGKHVLKLVSEAQYFNVSALSVLESGTTTTSGGTTSTGTTSGGTTSGGTTSGATSGSATIPAVGGAVIFACDFEKSVTECGFGEQNAAGDQPGARARIVNVPRTGAGALRLHTEPGDINVHGSGDWERNDVLYGPSSGYCNEGQEEWWAHSVLFPDDYVFPTGQYGGGIVFDFHHNYSSGQSNFEVQTMPGIGLRFEGHGGPSVDGGRYDYLAADPYGAPKGSITKNRWYDFVYHVKWTSASSGLMEAWLNGKKVMTFNGATLYSGISCYLKLANYHTAVGSPSSVIHDRVVRGSSAAAVALTPLEGVQ